MRRLAVLLALAFLAAAPAARADDPVAPPGAFVSLHDVAPTVIVEMRYITPHNFIGHPIDGYEEPLCLLTKQTAEAVARVQTAVHARGYSLKVYDCYRPQRAVDEFVAWGKRLTDQRMKAEFYPREPKRRVFKDGYIAEQSGHSRGSTLDLTLVERPAAKQEVYHRGDKLRDCGRPRSQRFRDNSIDMGTGYDCFDPLAHPYNARIKGKQRANRLKLRRAMLAEGFKGLDTEWWHFTLKAEPFPDTFFDFPVSSAPISAAP